MELKVNTRMRKDPSNLLNLSAHSCKASPAFTSSLKFFIYFHIYSLPSHDTTTLPLSSSPPDCILSNNQVNMSATVSIRSFPSRLHMLSNRLSTPSISPIYRRSFASTSSNLATWGFIGLGRMGELHASLSRVEAPPCPRQRPPVEE